MLRYTSTHGVYHVHVDSLTMGKKVVVVTIASSFIAWFVLSLSFVLSYVKPETFAWGRRLLFASFNVSVYVFSTWFSFGGVVSILSKFISIFTDKLTPIISMSPHLNNADLRDFLCDTGGLITSACDASYFLFYCGVTFLISIFLGLTCHVIASFCIWHHWESGVRHGKRFKKFYSDIAIRFYVAGTIVCAIGFTMFSVAIGKFFTSIVPIGLPNTTDPGFAVSWFIALLALILLCVPPIIVPMQKKYAEYDADEDVEDEFDKHMEHTQLNSPNIQKPQNQYGVPDKQPFMVNDNNMYGNNGGYYGQTDYNLNQTYGAAYPPPSNFVNAPPGV